MRSLSQRPAALWAVQELAGGQRFVMTTSSNVKEG